MKGSDLALIDHCTDVQCIAVGSRIVGEQPNCLDFMCRTVSTFSKILEINGIFIDL